MSRSTRRSKRIAAPRAGLRRSSSSRASRRASARAASARTRVCNIAFFSIVALIAWAAWALVTFEVGSRLMPEPRDARRRRRAASHDRLRGDARPAARLWASCRVPRRPVFVITSIWMLLAMVVAVRQALDYRARREPSPSASLGWVLAMAFAVVLGWCSDPRS